MLHVILPAAAYSREDGHTNWGYCDTEIGVKYRLLDGGPDGSGLMAGTFPIVVLPTGDEHLGLGGGDAQVFLPIWLQKDFGPWTTYGGGGYWVNPGTGNQNYWFVGWLLQRQVTDQLTLGGEVFNETADTVDGVDSTGFNLGGVYDFSPQLKWTSPAVFRGDGHPERVGDQHLLVLYSANVKFSVFSPTSDCEIFCQQ